MTYNVNATFMSEQTKIEGSFPINMYAINASPTGESYLYYANTNSNIVGYQIDSNGDLIVATTLYTALPIETDDVRTNISGEIGETSISVPNTDRIIESYIQSSNYLRGCVVYAITMFAKHLPSGSNPQAIGEAGEDDYNAALIEEFYIDGVSSNESVVTFSCKPKFVIKNVILPGRRYNRECSWDFDSIECNPLSKSFGVFVTCPGTLNACASRTNASFFGGFPSIPRRSR